MKNAPPWLLLMLGLLVGVPAVRLAVPTARTEPAAPAAPAATPGSPAGESPSCKGTGGAPPPAWCEPVRVLSEFFGLPVGESREKVVAGVAQAARMGGYDLRFFTALVPVPPDPRLDQALEAVQRGFAQSDYLLDRAWLPWSGDAAKREASSQEKPGLLLFRGAEVDGSRSLVLVFLVGETPKAGVQKAAFRDTLDLIADLQGAASDPTVALLGPTYSGSVESLRLALLSWQAQEKEHQRRLSLRFHAATGSATASGLEQTFAEANVDFCRTVLPDEELHGRSLSFLRDEMGWDLHRVALLTEADTAYGRSLLDAEASEAGEASHERLVVVPFPSHISELRNAAEQEKAAQEKAAKGDKGDKTPLPASQKALELALVDSDRPPDLVPAYSPLTVHGNERMLANLLQTVSREGIRYVGILATDVKDKLFLAEKVHELAPDALLFTLDNNLLYAHPQYAQTMDGMLVFSSSPLFTEGAPGASVSLSPGDTRERRQFTSELQQGIYEAVRYLLGEAPVPPRAWITAVGNGSLWPIARLRVKPGTARLCGAKAPEKPQARTGSRRWRAEGNGFAGKDDLQILLVAILLSVFAWRLRRVALLEPVAGSRLDPTPGNRWLLVMGTVLLALAAGVLLAVGSVPVWGRGISLWLVSWDPTRSSTSWAWVRPTACWWPPRHERLTGP